MKRNEQSLGLIKWDLEDLHYQRSSNESSTFINFETLEEPIHNPLMSILNFDDLPTLSSFMFHESTYHSNSDEILT